MQFRQNLNRRWKRKLRIYSSTRLSNSETSDRGPSKYSEKPICPAFHRRVFLLLFSSFFSNIKIIYSNQNRIFLAWHFRTWGPWFASDVHINMNIMVSLTQNSIARRFLYWTETNTFWQLPSQTRAMHKTSFLLSLWSKTDVFWQI